MSWSIRLVKTGNTVTVENSYLDTLPDGPINVSGHVYGGPGSAGDSVQVTDSRGLTAATYRTSGD